MAAEVERKLLNHYKLTTLQPAEWPHQDHDESDASDDDGDSPANATSRLARLDRQLSTRSALTAPQRAAAAAEGADSLVQTDEPDPLGIAPSLVHALHRRGLPVQENLKLRNRFMLSSTTFSPTLFLSQLHHDASTDDLLNGLDFLSRSIEKKSASLKILVESNFERFVRAKATIDNVYTEMRTQGVQQLPVAQDPRRPHSRHPSRSSTHFRTSSAAFSPVVAKSLATDRKKNALTKESEYGVLGIKAPLIELAIKADEVWGPALGGRDKEEELRTVLSYLEHNRPMFRIGATLHEAIATRDHQSLIDAYNRATKLAEDARETANNATQTNAPLTDAQLHHILIAAKVWSDVQIQVAAFKRDAWKQLSDARLQREAPSPHMDLIATLLQLGVDENPIWLWLSSRYHHLKDKVTRSFDRMRAEIELSRRQLANADQPSLHVSTAHLQSATAALAQDRKNNMDEAKIIDLWEKIQSALHSLLAPQNALLGDIVDFWLTAHSFISGEAQRTLPNATLLSRQSRQLLQLSDKDVVQLHNFASDLINLMQENLLAFFVDPPVEDISALFSPIPSTPQTASGAITPNDSMRTFNFDTANIPQPSPKRGDSWEKYAFWPPYANSLSGAYYLGRIVPLVGTAVSELANLSLNRDNARGIDQLKNLINCVRERCVQAVCAAWNDDAEKCKHLEDWSRNSERKDLTNMPFQFIAYEEVVLSSVQKIMHISEATNKPASADVLVPPSAKLLQIVRQQFVNSIYKALSGTVENAERVKKLSNSSFQGLDDLTTPVRTGSMGDPSTDTVDASDRNVRLLLTLSNLNHLRRETVPQLISQFETSFSVKLNEESKTVRDVLVQIDARLFQSYVKPTVDRLSAIISTGISSPTWVPPTNRPRNAKPYVYDVLLSIVLVHTEVSTTATTLTNQMLSYLLEQISGTLLIAFKQRPSYTLSALMQATLDVELIAQTLSNYTTEKASETQSQIYLVLDERTDHDARMRLQGELPEMRSILKKLRESTKGQFGCFKRERRGRSERSTSKTLG